MLNKFKNKSVGFYLTFSAAAAFVLLDIIFIACDGGDRTFSYLTFAMILVGAALSIAGLFLDFKFLDFMPLLGCACYGVAFAAHLKLALESLSDVWNGVNFVGGNATAGMTFAGLFLVLLCVSVVGCFLGVKDKSQKSH